MATNTYSTLSDFIENHKQFQYLNETEITNNIETVLNCNIKETGCFKQLKGGYMNPVFTFVHDDCTYVYRYPGKGSEKFINRESEAAAHRVAKKMHLDDALIWIDESGHKISFHIPEYRYFDYKDKSDVKKIVTMMHQLHNSNELCGFKYDIHHEIEKFYAENVQYRLDIYPNIDLLRAKVNQVYETLNKDNAQVSLCHNDIYTTNILISDTQLYLIDWEFAKDAHPALDLTTFLVCSPYTQDEIETVLKMYLDDRYNDHTRLEYYRYFTVGTFYWLLWALHTEANGGDTEGFVQKYYNYLMMFLNILEGEF